MTSGRANTWLDILYLAERLGSGPSLLPADREGQVECIGLSHQICGEDGLGWNRRLKHIQHGRSRRWRRSDQDGSARTAVQGL